MENSRSRIQWGAPGLSERLYSENLLDFACAAMVWLSDQQTEGVPMTFPRTAMSAVHKATSAAQIILISVLSLMSLPALAQSTAGRVLGTITDQSGASVAGATVI